MAFSSTQIGYLKNADQRFTAHVALFPAYSPVITTPAPGNGTALNLKPMPMASPRYSVVANDGSITLYATDSYNRGGTYVGNANIAWANTGGAGALVDNGDGTATYTAPADGAGTNLITMTATNANGSKAANVYVAYPKTTYDTLVSEVASISGGLSQRGWSVLFRVHGDTSDFAIGKIVLLHVEDTWGVTTSTFGGYKYSENVFTGYITQMQYYEDSSGLRWLGVEAKSSWSKLENMQLSETMWGKTSRVGRYYRNDFVPVDALWYLLSETTDFCSRHNCTLFYDTNSIDDLIIGRGTDSQVSFADIVADIMARGLAIAYTDRYSSLMCIPDPDVRSAEWWGTPSPEYDGSNPLTEKLCTMYNITKFEVPVVRRLALVAFDSYRLGMWAACQASAGTPGREEKIPGLLCDDTLKLVSWCSEKRAQMNKPWDITVDLPLNHTVDICTPLVAIMTAPSNSNAPTASALCWVDNVGYRPSMDGAWNGNWHLVKNSQGDTGQNGEVSGWGGSGQWGQKGTGVGIAPSGWNTAIPQGDLTWVHNFNFTETSGGWITGNYYNWYGLTTEKFATDPVGTWVTGYGWSSNIATAVTGEFSGITTLELDIARFFSERSITAFRLWWSAPAGPPTNAEFSIRNESAFLITQPAAEEGTQSSYLISSFSASRLCMVSTFAGNTGVVYKSAQMAGLGTDPFG